MIILEAFFTMYSENVAFFFFNPFQAIWSGVFPRNRLLVIVQFIIQLSILLSDEISFQLRMETIVINVNDLRIYI